MRMPVVFSGHGSPMVALEDNEVTHGMREVGDKIIDKYGKPKAILAISAHWYVPGSYVQSAPNPEQVYDMYGFPQELYDFKYPVVGNRGLTDAVLNVLGNDVKVNDEWGIDHGTWTVLCHMFPQANIPVVQLSVNRNFSMKDAYEFGKKLVSLRDEGYLIFASGNTVHNLMRVEWDNPKGTIMTDVFNNYITKNVEEKNHEAVINYRTYQYADYAVPTPDHFLPLLYTLGASDNDDVTVFNKINNLGSMSMTGFIFGF